MRNSDTSDQVICDDDFFLLYFFPLSISLAFTWKEARSNESIEGKEKRSDSQSQSKHEKLNIDVVFMFHFVLYFLLFRCLIPKTIPQFTSFFLIWRKEEWKTKHKYSCAWVWEQFFFLVRWKRRKLHGCNKFHAEIHTDSHTNGHARRTCSRTCLPFSVCVCGWV